MIRFIFIIFIIWFSHFWWALFSINDIKAPIIITIDHGLGVNEILFELKKQGAVKNIFETKVYIAAKGIGDSMRAGTYEFSESISTARVIKIISKTGGQEREVPLTLIEGWTIDDMAIYISRIEELSITEESFISAAQSKKYESSIITHIPKERTLEGYLFPDTYRVFIDITAAELVEKMLNTFDEKVAIPLKNDFSNNKRTFDEIIILASILEKELKTLEDKKKAADVFLKRLEKGIALQADSTVNYVTGKNVTRASQNDILIDSPYNTYKYRGLPPGPISTPGLDSIFAALNPEKNNYYYFLTTLDGRALFSETLEEHNNYKRTYYP